eukprot:jgi/Botrbrau1/7374/Bobra.0316s0018.1
MSDGYTALVTGASGYIATELVKQLLEKGYHVIATHRAQSDDDPKVSHLLRLANALPGTIELYSADLLQPNSFDEAVSKADYVFHMASPFLWKVDDPQTQLVDPAVNGTRNVLGSVAKLGKRVKRVVVTSSVAAIRSKQPSDGVAWSEQDWNDWSTLSDNPYMLSKTLAEKAAWEIAQENGLDLVTINPSFVVGPVISSRIEATSVLTLQAITEGKSATLFPRLVDVRDVARAHILAAEVPEASGRYVVSWETTISPKAALSELQAAFPQYVFQEGADAPEVREINAGKVHRDLKLQLRNPVESLKDMTRTLVALKMAVPQLRDES